MTIYFLWHILLNFHYSNAQTNASTLYHDSYYFYYEFIFDLIDGKSFFMFKHSFGLIDVPARRKRDIHVAIFITNPRRNDLK